MSEKCKPLEEFCASASPLLKNGVLGELSGIDISARDQLFQKFYQQVKSEMERVERAGATDRVELDVSPLSGVNGGDFFVWDPDSGRWSRKLSVFPEFEALLRDYGRHFPRCDGEIGEYPFRSFRNLALRAAYNGLWSPSGTNWQPMRILELSPNECSQIFRLAGISANSTGPACAIIGQRFYRSLLDDVAKVCMYRQRSKADTIDIGIYTLSCELTFFDRGICPAVHEIPLDAQKKVGAYILEILAERKKHLVGNSCKEELEKVEWLEEYISQDRAFVDSVLAVSHPLDGTEPKDSLDFKSSFDRLIEFRCTQRVASPERDLPLGEFRELWELALQSILPEERGDLGYSVYSWRDPVPQLIGRAMFEGLYGKGADHKTRRGGVNGIIHRANYANLLAWIESQMGELPGEIRELKGLSEEEIESKAREIPMPLRAVPPFLMAHLNSGGRFTPSGEFLLDRRGKPMSLALFLKVVQHLLFSFGTFFLQFQNTHPITAVLLAREGLEPQRQRRAYKNLGRIAQALSLLARARGYISIIKEGPIEFAAETIQKLVAEYEPDRSFARQVEEGEFFPRLTFQIGYPLGPEEIIQSVPEPHTGLEERLRDKRLPRAKITSHYYPLV